VLDGFGLSYTKEYRVRGGVYRAQGGVYVEHRVVFRWFGLSYIWRGSKNKK